jgi:hemerythrin-like domain-containing protein
MKTDELNTGVNRRHFLQKGIIISAATLLGGAGLLASCRMDDKKEGDEKDEDKDKKEGEEEIGPGEDLMREHGVLNRVLLIRKFIEDYHEKQEEDFLFPRFKKANKLADLVDTLKQQHDAGRRLTDQIMAYGKMQKLSSDDDRKKLSGLLTTFNIMYRPHEAREDTVLFPALHQIVSQNEYDSLGEDFEKREHQIFGQDGFELYVSKVTDIEKRLGIYDLNQFTPKA